MVLATNLGYPRIGPDRELKKELEAYWAGRIPASDLLEGARTLRRAAWELQRDAGIVHVPSNDFSLYDHVLDTVALVGAVPDRFGWTGEGVDLETYFAMARGTSARSGSGGAQAMEMTKWFDTNYHYLVPEVDEGTELHLTSTKPMDEFAEAAALGIHTRPVLLGPLTFLALGKATGPGDPMRLLPRLLRCYAEVLRRLGDLGASWVQIDEPALVLDLEPEVSSAFADAYARLADAAPGLRLLVATYFGGPGENLPLVLDLPVAAVHLDLVRAPELLDEALRRAPSGLVLSLGVVDGRNVWRTDLDGALETIERACDHLGPERVLVAPSCSLLHVPQDLDRETGIDPELGSWLAFARQKLEEVALLARGVNEGRAGITEELRASREACESRARSRRVRSPEVRRRVAAISPEMLERESPFSVRRKVQHDELGLPPFPTTTIGSFPQTREVRRARARHRAGRMSTDEYLDFLRAEVARVVRLQEGLGLDILVHGEFERNDMVEYFGERLEGFSVTANGWVQSYGSRCVKPPILYGDVSRPEPMTIEWGRYARSLTSSQVKGMLTGPVTILQWSFVRDDQPRSDTCRAIALAIRDEVADLEAEGIRIIQIDEPALREGLPLRLADRPEYLRWAVEGFRLTSGGVRDGTQIHTHMCYAEFNDIMDSIIALDADVISIEASRSRMDLLDVFVRRRYPNEIGPGVWDIHSPRVPGTDEMDALLERALQVLTPDQLWVNPDCGLKTRGWEEVERSLANMVAAARALRTRAGALDAPDSAEGP
jgi:5-methyltetrahydropteroyltriglutamate--homocysteine methyltransferase